MGTQLCRLCYNESNDISPEGDYLQIYSLSGLLHGLDKKIQNFLYLDVGCNDEYSKDVCPACCHEITAFTKFYDRVHATQKRYLGESKYNSVVLKSITVRQISSISSLTNAKLESSPTTDFEPSQSKAFFFDDSECEAPVKAINVNKPKVKILPQPLTRNIKVLSDPLMPSFNVAEYEAPVQDIKIGKRKAEVQQIQNIKKPRKQVLLPKSRRTAEEVWMSSSKESQNITTAIEQIRDSESDTDDGYTKPAQKLYPSRGARIPNFITEDETGSNNDFPPRDPSNEDLPAPEILAKCEMPVQAIKIDKPKVEILPQPLTRNIKVLSDPLMTSFNATEYEAPVQDIKIGKRKAEVKQVQNIKKPRKQLLLPMKESPSNAEKLLMSSFKESQNTTTSIEQICDSESDTDDGYTKPAQKLYPSRGARIPNFITEDETGSNNDFPPRDPSNEDLPAPEILATFPKTILKNGKIAIGQKQLMLITSNFYKLECDMCPSDKRPRFKYIKSLFNHYRDAHRVRGHISCCNNKFIRYDTITLHMVRHIQPEPFRCDVCGYLVTLPRLLESHKAKHLPESERPFKCSFEKCKRRFSSCNALKNHLVLHQHPDERIQYVCHICGKKFDRSYSMHSHMYIKHSDRSKSNKKFIKSTKPKPEAVNQSRNIECPVCYKMYTSKAYMCAHKKAVHENVELQCSLCNFKTKWKGTLVTHLNRTHNDERPYQCDFCEVRFKSKFSQGEHMLRHTNPEKAAEMRKLRLRRRRENGRRKHVVVKKKESFTTYLDIKVLDEVALDSELELVVD